MMLSYAITVKNEIDEIKRLIPFLLEHKNKQDEIIVLLDRSEGSDPVYDYLSKLDSENEILLRISRFNQISFSGWKNSLNAECEGDYIFQIDADEIPHLNLIQNIHEIIELMPNDLFYVPRINIVEGITPEHIQKWGWNINEKGWINWADYQSRIYRNSPAIRWVNNVHEHIEGFKTYSLLPLEEQWSLYHHKTIERQEKQNQLYESI